MLIPVPQPFGVFGTMLIIQDSHYCRIPFSNVKCIMQKRYLARMWPVRVTSMQSHTLVICTNELGTRLSLYG